MSTLEKTNSGLDSGDDPGHNSVVNGVSTSEIYVATPVWVANYVVFPYDFGPEGLVLFESFDSAPMHMYGSVEEFIADERPDGDDVGTLNFLGFFQQGNSVSAQAKRSVNALKRLEVLNPELVENLRSSLRDAARISDLSPDLQKQLFEAYTLMSQMVDVNDSNVYRLQPDGSYQVDSDYLKH